MQGVAIILVMLSACIHAGWNLFSKRQHPTAAFFLLTSLTGALLLAPVLLTYRATLLHFPPEVWVLLPVTGFFMALYYIALAGAYRAGDMSIAYPLARSSPVIVVSVVTFVLGRGDQVSAWGVAGSILVVAGCFLIPLKHLGELRLKKYLSATCGLAFLAAVGTSGYSIVDDEALRLLRQSPELSLGVTRVTLLYACLEAASAALWLTLFVAVRPLGRSDLRRVLGTKRRQAFLTGASIYLSYSMILVALAYARNVSYIVGFRQLSIPLGALLGVVVLKEAPHPCKLAGVLVMFVGLLLLAFG